MEPARTWRYPRPSHLGRRKHPRPSESLARSGSRHSAAKSRHSERMTCRHRSRERYGAMRVGVRRSHVRYSRTARPASQSAVRSFGLRHSGRRTSTSPSAVGRAKLTFKPGESPRAVTTSMICGAWTSLSSSPRRYESNRRITHRRLPASTVTTAAPWRLQPRRTSTLKRTGQ